VQNNFVPAYVLGAPQEHSRQRAFAKVLVWLPAVPLSRQFASTPAPEARL